MKRLLPLLPFALTMLLLSCSTPQVTTTGEWQPLGGPSGREVTTVFADPLLPRVLYAGLATGEVFRSDDEGGQWVRLGVTATDAVIRRFVATVDTPVTFYALTSDGLYRATPNKRVWTKAVLGSLPSGTGVSSLVIDPWNPTTLYVGTEAHGIYRSKDGGRTWQESNGDLPGLATATVADLTQDASRPDVLAAAASGLGIILSRDGGATWQRLTEEFTATGSQAMRVLFGGPTGHDLLYATTAGGMAMSTDNGASWRPTRIAREGSGILSIDQVKQAPSTLLAGTEAGAILSTDFGQTWSDASGTLPHVRSAAAFGHDAPGTLFAFGEALGLQRSTNGGLLWQRADEGLGGSIVRFLTTSERGEYLFVGLRSTIVGYDPATGQWIPAGPGLDGDTVLSLSAATDAPLTSVAATNAGAYRTTDGGKSWLSITRKLPETPRMVELFPRVKTRIMASGDHGLFVSTDRGESWQRTHPVSARFAINAFTVVSTNVAIVYATTRGDGVILSKDGGFHWERSRYGIDADNLAMVSMDDKDHAVAYAWTPTGEAFRTLNEGLEWNRYAPPWKSGDTVALAVDRFLTSSAVALIGGRTIYYSANGGGTWHELPQQDLRGEVTSMLWNDQTGMLYAAVRHRGVYRLSLRAAVNAALGTR